MLNRQRTCRQQSPRPTALIMLRWILNSSSMYGQQLYSTTAMDWVYNTLGVQETVYNMQLYSTTAMDRVYNTLGVQETVCTTCNSTAQQQWTVTHWVYKRLCVQHATLQHNSNGPSVQHTGCTRDWVSHTVAMDCVYNKLCVQHATL